MGLQFEELTAQIIGAAIQVHKQLGPGFLESIYENALVIELKKWKLAVEQQKEIIVRFEGFPVGRHRIDLFVGNEIVVDLKAVKALEDVHFAVVKSQLKAMGRTHGLLLNFAGVKLEPRRVTAGY